MTECIVVSPLAITLHWEGNTLIELHLSWAESLPESSPLSQHAATLKEALEQYVAGKKVTWPDMPYGLSRLSEFQQAVLAELRTIPQGATCAYGELAARIGKPKAAQAIGRAMGANPFPLVYPCHRIIGNNGSMTGFSAQGGVQLKQFLLRHEGAIL